MTGRSISRWMSSRSLKPSMPGMCTSVITRSNSAFPALSIFNAVFASVTVVAVQQQGLLTERRKDHLAPILISNGLGRRDSRLYLQQRRTTSSTLRQTLSSSTASTRSPSGNLSPAGASILCLSSPPIAAMFSEILLTWQGKRHQETTN